MDIDRDSIGTIVIIREKGRLWDHYGILDGKGNVIHVHKKKGIISKDPLYRFILKSTYIKYIEDDFDNRYKRYLMAEALIGSKYDYALFSQNCESWVNHISHGNLESKQVNSLCQFLATAIVGYTAITSILSD